MGLSGNNLSFKNPVFHEGVNLTVREGAQWAKVNIGDRLNLVSTDRSLPPVGTGSVVGKMLLLFKALPEEIIRLEHDSAYQTKINLFRGMKEIYSGFSESNLVTVIFFTVL